MRLFLLGALVLGGCPERSTPLGVVDKAACSFADPADPDRAVFATVRDRDVVLVRGDGSEETLHSFGAGRTLSWLSPQIEAKDGFLLASATIYEEGAAGPLLETVLLSDDGEPLWSRTDGPGTDVVHLGADGQVALTGWAGGTRVVAPSGVERVLDGFYAMTGPLADGTVAVRRIGWGSFVWGWMQPGDVVPAPPAFTADQSDVRFVGDRALYVTTTETGARMFVDERPDRIRVTMLPLAEEEYVYLVSANEGFALLQDSASLLPTVLVDLTRADATRLAITLPDGHRAFNYTEWDAPRIDEQGALMLSLRDDAVGGLFRSLDGGINWRRVGASVSNVLGVRAQARAGTYVVAATNLLYSWEEWPETASADLVGDSVQIVRPSSGVSQAIAPFGNLGASISPDGRCVATWHDKLHIIDADSGEEHLFAPSTGVAWLDF